MKKDLTPKEAELWIKNGVPTYSTIHARYELGDFYSLNRREFTSNVSFAIPCREAINAIQKYSPKLLELGAGTGYWSKLLCQYGTDIIATDNYSGKYNQNIGRYYPVRSIDSIEATRIYFDLDIFMSWPCLDKLWSANVLKQILPGKYVFLISEGKYGCVGHDKTFNLLDIAFSSVDRVSIPQWYGMHDYLSIWQRK